MLHRSIAFLAALLMLAASAFAQQPRFTLPQLKALAAMTPDEFKAEVRRLDFSFRDRTNGDWVSMVTYDKFVDEQTTSLMKSTYKDDRASDNIQLSVTDKSVFDALEKEVRSAGFLPSTKGRIPGGETYQDFKRRDEFVRFVYPKKVEGMGRLEYSVVVPR